MLNMALTVTGSDRHSAENSHLESSEISYFEKQCTHLYIVQKYCNTNEFQNTVHEPFLNGWIQFNPRMSYQFEMLYIQTVVLQ